MEDLRTTYAAKKDFPKVLTFYAGVASHIQAVSGYPLPLQGLVPAENDLAEKIFRQEVLLVWQGRSLLGAACVSPGSAPSPGGAMLQACFLHPDCQSYNAFRLLFARILRHCALRGFSRLYTCVYACDIFYQNLYEHLGFCMLGPIDMELRKYGLQTHFLYEYRFPQKNK